MFKLENFAQRLTALREGMGLTKSQLARALGVTPSTIGNLEHARKRPSLEAVVQMADFFGVSVDYMVGRFPEPAEDMDFPTRIGQLRMARGLSHRAIGTAIGTSHRNYIRYEDGSQQPTLPVLIKLSSFYQVSLDYLVGITESPYKR